MPLTISTFDDALSFLQARDASTAPTEGGFKLTGDVTTLRIKVEGSRYAGTVPAELARGLWEFQEAIYKATAFALYGSYDQRKLTLEQHDRFELVFEITQSSTGISAKFDKIIEAIAEAIKDMESKDKLHLLIVIALLIAGAYVAREGIQAYTSTHQATTEATARGELDRQHTRHLELMADVVKNDQRAKRFSDAAEEGTRALLRGVPDATQLTIGKNTFDSDQIRDANQRAPKTRSSAEVIQEQFLVYAMETRSSSSTKYVLARPNGTEFPVTVDHESFTPQELEKLWHAAKDRSKILLEVNLTLNKGAIRSAQLTQIL